MTHDSTLTVDINRILLPLLATLVVRACLVWLLGRGHVSVRASTGDVAELRSVLIVLPPMPSPAPMQAPQAVEPLRADEARRPTVNTAERPTGIHDPAVNAPTLRIEAGVSRAPIDWGLEAELSAKNAATQMYAKPQQRSLDGSEAGHRAAQTPIKKPDFDWRPQTKRYGLTPEGVPYFQLNDRCVLVLFLIGCGIGKMPPPNRELFEDMGHPHLPTSSVPGANE